MRLDEIISEDQFDWEAETAEEIFLADPQGQPRIGAFKPGMQGLDYKLVARTAKGLSGNFPNNQRGAIRHVIDKALASPQKSAPKPKPEPQKTAPKPAPAVEPQPKKSRGAQIGNQNARKSWEPTSAIGKKIQKGQELSKKLGGIGSGAQRRNRNLNPFN